jgi:hypothetical protein
MICSYVNFFHQEQNFLILIAVAEEEGLDQNLNGGGTIDCHDREFLLFFLFLFFLIHPLGGVVMWSGWFDISADRQGAIHKPMKIPFLIYLTRLETRMDPAAMTEDIRFMLDRKPKSSGLLFTKSDFQSYILEGWEQRLQEKMKSVLENDQ